MDTHADSGTVRSINLFYTVLVTADNKVISIPNGNLANQPTVNYSKEKVRRLDVDFSVSYKNDLENLSKAQQRLQIEGVFPVLHHAACFAAASEIKRKLPCSVEAEPILALPLRTRMLCSRNVM